MASDVPHCGGCKMYDDGRCWGYGNVLVDPLYVCDSFAPSLTALDDAAMPLSGGAASEGGLQMIPETGGKAKPKRRRRKSVDDVGEDQQRSREAPDPHDVEGEHEPHAHTLDAATAEPTARWFDRLLSQDRLREAFDGCRDHIEAAVGPAALLVARQMAHQAANGVSVTTGTAPADLADTLTRHYEDMYRLGHQTVADELAKQRAVLGRQLDDPADATAGGVAATRLGRARQRGEHSARNVANKVGEILGRQQITGLKDPAALQTAAERAATAQLRVEALANTAAMVNDGRYDGAMSAGDVVGGVITSVMDSRSCDPCIAADTGQVLPPEEAIAYGPPNPDCQGGDYCRCVIVWVLSTDPAAAGAALG